MSLRAAALAAWQSPHTQEIASLAGEREAAAAECQAPWRLRFTGKGMNRVANGSLAETWDYVDTMSALGQMGRFPEPGQGPGPQWKESFSLFRVVVDNSLALAGEPEAAAAEFRVVGNTTSGWG